MIVTIVLVDEAGEEVSFASEMAGTVDLEEGQEEYGLGLSAAKVRRAETRVLIVPAAGPAALGDPSAYCGEDILRIYGILVGGALAEWDIPSPRDDIFESDTRTLDMSNLDVIAQVAIIQSTWKGPDGEDISSIIGGERMAYTRCDE